MYYTQAHLINDLWIRPDVPIPARIAAMDVSTAMVTFSIEISEIWEHVPRFPKFWEAFRNFRKSGKNLLGGLLRRMITVLLSEK